MSNWNEDGVEILKKLWAEGHSASQIAGRIGGVSRSAVISKVHRLGLSGRATTNRSKSRSKKYAGPIAISPPKPKPIQWNNFNAPAVADIERKSVEPYLELPTHRVFDPGKMVRTADLEDDHCRWPIGDPQTPEFRHCGEPKIPSLTVPYCIKCFPMAFQPRDRINGNGSSLRQDGREAVVATRDTQETERPAGDAPRREMEEA